MVCPDGQSAISPTGVEVDFFGEPHPDAGGAGRSPAVETGGGIVAHTLVRAARLGFQVYPALDCTSGDAAAITQALANRFAQNIAAHPADWHMLQPQWLADLSNRTAGATGVRKA